MDVNGLLHRIGDKQGTTIIYQFVYFDTKLAEVTGSTEQGGGLR